MEMVEGTPYRTSAELNALGDPQRVENPSHFGSSTLSPHCTLSRPESVGLGDFGRTKGFPRSTSGSGGTSRWSPRTRATFRLLMRSMSGCPCWCPRSLRPAIVHGDYRLDNVLIDADDRPAAVIDWEMATVGDPLTDLGSAVGVPAVGQHCRRPTRWPMQRPAHRLSIRGGDA